MQESALERLVEALQEQQSAEAALEAAQQVRAATWTLMPPAIQLYVAFREGIPYASVSCGPILCNLSCACTMGLGLTC